MEEKIGKVILDTTCYPVADWSRTDYPLWKSFSGLSFSGCDCTANF